MNEQTDQQLLRNYAERQSEAAFAELVRRHVDLVHSASLRMVCDAHLAEDVTQAAFVALAQNARELTPRPVLSGWLHRTAQNLATKVVRTEVRRRAREQEAAAMNELLSAEPDSGWEHIAPHLDAALGELSEPDRDALLLRYFERKSAHEMAQTLGISDEAAQKRVSRAVERLREFFAKRGITVGASGLVVVISANAVQAAPVGLAVTISTAAALAGTTLAATTTATAIKTIAMTTLQKTLVTATVAALAGAGIYEAIQHSKLRRENESQQQQSAQLKLESESLSNRLPVVADAKSPPDEQFKELLRLRGQVGVLRRQKTELESSLANARNSQLRGPNPGPGQQPPPASPEDYPKTADSATKGIFESFAGGDLDAFYAKFDVEGGRELFEKAFSTEAKSSLLGLEVVSIGTPTNSFGRPNVWFVPYTIRLKNGGEKAMRLHVAQDSKTQRWILKGGF